MDIVLNSFAPKTNDLLLIARPYGGGIGIEVWISSSPGEWRIDDFLHCSLVQHLQRGRLLVKQGEYASGWFYWIWRKEADTEAETPTHAAVTLENTHGRLVFD